MKKKLVLLFFVFIFLAWILRPYAHIGSILAYKSTGATTSTTLDQINITNDGVMEFSNTTYSIIHGQLNDTTSSWSYDSMGGSSYQLLHGQIYPYSKENVYLNLFSAIPEARNTISGDNFSTKFYIKVKEASTGNLVYETYSSDFETNDQGLFTQTIELVGVNRGTYDVVMYGYSHLGKKKTQYLHNAPATNSIDFTDDGSGPGSAPLLGGDVYTDTGNFIDRNNVVDSSDFGSLLAEWSSESIDSGVSENISDINEDGRVDSTDMGILIGNWGTEGD